MSAYTNRLIYLSAILGAGYLVFGPERASVPLVRRAEDGDNTYRPTDAEIKMVFAGQAASKCAPSADECIAKVGCDSSDLSELYKCVCEVYDGKMAPCLKSAAASDATCSADEDQTVLENHRIAFRDFCVEKKYPMNLTGAAATGASISSSMAVLSMLAGIFAL